MKLTPEQRMVVTLAIVIASVFLAFTLFAPTPGQIGPRAGSHVMGIG